MFKAQPDRCEEAAIGMPGYFPCNQPATKVIGWKGRSDTPIRMCDCCADHNVRNRGGEEIGPYPLLDWDDPAARAALIERVGPDVYNRLMKKHQEDSAVATVNGYRIRPVGTRFGRLMMVDGTDKAFRDQADAETFAKGLPPREPV